MCGRYTLTASAEQVQQAFNLDSVPAQLAPRYNIAPTQPIAVITNDQPKQLTFVTWGLVPSWSKDTSMAGQLINARAETLSEKASFRTAYKYRRCLVPADGFYEWRKDGKGKTPVYIHKQDRGVFAMAGLWERWVSKDGSEVLSATIVTTDPNDMISKMHHRMAVILQPEDYELWLSPKAEPLALQSLLKPYPSDDLRAYDVSTEVNNARFDSPSMIEPFAAPQQTPLL
jgi:putative SOS response-associated peptidase YedK